jgi:DNA-binding XRE family transcriptional regulator
MTLQQAVSEAVKAARHNAGITQKTLADKIGLPLWAVTKLEAGNYDITLHTLEKIAVALKADIDIVLK